jgi:hypothetical protein
MSSAKQYVTWAVENKRSLPTGGITSSGRNGTRDCGGAGDEGFSFDAPISQITPMTATTPNTHLPPELKEGCDGA